MATELIIDKVDGAKLQNGSFGTRIIQPILIKGLPAGSCPDTAALIRATNVAGFPRYNDPHPDNATLRLINLELRGVRSEGTILGDLIYETRPIQLPGGYPISNFVLEDRTQLVAVQTEKIDGAVISVFASVAGSISGPFQTKTGSIRYFQPLRNLTAAGANQDYPPDYIYAAIGSVNATPWRGLPAGYWLFMGVDARTNSKSNDAKYDVEINFLSNVNKDWSAYDVFENEKGKLPVDDKVQAQIQGYSYPDVRNTNRHIIAADGITRVAPYPMAEFNQLFNFTQ